MDNLKHDSPRPDELIANHSPDNIRKRLDARPSQTYLKDFIYGAIDGTVTTFAVVSGVAGAGLSSSVVIVLGVANLVGDGFSMAASNYLGSRAEEQLRENARQMEMRHISIFPEGEREEIRQIFADKGFSGDDLETVVAVITAEEQRWVDTMLTEELGMSLTPSSPVKAAWTTFLAFVLIGFVPLLPFIAQLFGEGLISQPYMWSCLLAAVAFFAVGASKSVFVLQHWFWAGCETMLLGGGAALLAYLIGAALATIVA
jgi:VIT1/CCC1 family predicted Fe2+/Mn2+ transporter